MMSNAAAAKPPTADFAQVGNVAHVNFRVLCEGLGHGEEVFLVEVNGTTTSTSASKVCFCFLVTLLVCHRLAVDPYLYTFTCGMIFFGVITMGCFFNARTTTKSFKRDDQIEKDTAMNHGKNTRLILEPATH